MSSSAATGRAPDGGDAVLRRVRELARAPTAEPPAQRRPMRMIHLGPLVLVDLPVDVVVVLEQQERACEADDTEHALRKR